MKDQVTSIEQSKRLLELGVPAERASMVWLHPIDTTDECYPTAKTGYYYPDERDTPAFTVVDLLGLLPKGIWDDCKGWCYLTIRFTDKKYSEIEYRGAFGVLWSCFGPSLLKNTIEAVEYVDTNGYGLNL